MHLKLDCPDSTGAGGSSDTAGLARRFFEAKNCQHFLDLGDGTVAEKAAFEKLHQNFAIILRIVSSKERLVDVDAFEQLCIETTLVLVEAFPWASFPQSVHPVLAHSAERIRSNGGHGLGLYSEEGLEALHKYVRRFKERLSKKSSLKDNLTDTHGHLWIRSDPIIRLKPPVLECSLCSGTGHTKRSCLTREDIASSSTSYDDIVEGYFL
jgi:hypothetical protein